jgi:hypothetical protein
MLASVKSCAWVNSWRRRLRVAAPGRWIGSPVLDAIVWNKGPGLKISLRRRPIAASKIALVGLLLGLASCDAAGSVNNSDNEKNSGAKNGGFYGGVTGGWSHP